MTQAKKMFGCYTKEDNRFEQAMYESIDKHSTAMLAERDALVAEVERLRKALTEMVSWFPSADTYLRLGFDPSAPMEALKEAKAALAAENARLRRGAHPAVTHCDNCGCDWLDNGLNPIGCPYCKQTAGGFHEAVT